MDHYSKATQDMDTRRIRKNGWNDIINAYMGKLPKNWPYQSVVTDPRIRTTILEKTARLLNSKLQGRLIPREGGDMIKARINNAILDFQWDNATDGGGMVEKVANGDQTARIFGASFAYVYWDYKRETNEIKICDPRDIFIDFGATHIRNAKWVQYREFTTIEALRDRGYDVSKLKKSIQNSQSGNSDLRSTLYESVVKSNRGLEDRVGEDMSNPVIEVITEYTTTSCTVFAPRYGVILKDDKNPYKHGKIPFAQLRYYPLGDDMYGESEVEAVIPLQRALNAILCGFIDEMNITMRPPLKISSSGVRIETIEYGPGARWIMQNPNMVEQAQLSGTAVQNFNNSYPALVAAFNTAMGSESLGTSNVKGTFTDKTATEVNQLQAQQSSRDQYNQLYLSEFLKDIMMMWLHNNKQFLFDDPSKEYFIIKIIGKDNIQQFQQMKLDEKDIPQDALNEIQATIEANPSAVTDDMINQVMQDVAVPTNPVVTNPSEQDPQKYDIKQKLEVKPNQDEADLYVTREDLDGVFDYIPDVKSMAAGAGVMQQQARQKAYDLILANPQVLPLLQTQGEMLKIKELLVNILEDAGERDAEGLFQPAGQQTGVQPGGPGLAQPGAMAPGPIQPQGMGGLPQTVPPPGGAGGIPQSQGVPIQ